VRRLLALSILAVATLGPPGPEAAPAEAASLVLPRTFEKTWYRTNKRSSFAIGRMHSAKGDLTITESGLEFVARNKKLYIPLTRVRVVSFGKMKGDVDTEWTVLALGESQPWEILGFRDGTKLGYGQATRQIYETIVGAARSARAAQYEAPSGYRVFDGFASQGTFAIPEPWEISLRDAKLGPRRAWGTVVFSPVKDSAGTEPSIFLGLHEGGKGMRCEGFSEEAAKVVFRLAEDHLLEEGFSGTENLETAPAGAGGCKGLRIAGSARARDGSPRTVEIRAVAHDGTLFLLGSYPPDGETGRTWREALETAVSTLTFPIAR